MQPRFNSYDEKYEELVERSIGWSGADHGFFLEAKAAHLMRLVRRHIGDPADMRAIDVGCGIGLLHRHLSDFRHLHGCDVSETSIARARRDNAHVAYSVAEASELPFDDGAFDVTFTVNLLHHVPPASRKAVVRECARVTRGSGLVVVFEHNPLNPLTRLSVGRCEFDDDAILLGSRELRRLLAQARLPLVEHRYIIVFPWHGSTFRRIEDVLSRLPLGAQHYAAAAK